MKHCFSAFLLAALLVSCVNEKLVNVVVPEDSLAETTGADNGVFVSGEAYVYFSEELADLVENDLASGVVRTKSAELNQTLEVLGITEMRRIFPHAGKFEPRTRQEGLHRWYAVKYSEAVPRTKAEDTFLAMDGIEYVEPAVRIKINDFNDPYFGNIWSLVNVEHPEFDINVKPVWDNYTTGDPKVIVSVVDSGIDYMHEDLAANCVADSEHYNSVNSSAIVPEEHATHVAGTIAAVGNNGKGVTGIAGGDKANGKAGVRLMSCQIFAGNAGGDSAAAIKWGADHGAVISQNSWGYVFDSDGDGKLSPAELEVAKNTSIRASDKAAIDYFIKYAGMDEFGNQVGPMAGGIVIFAAGNDNTTYGPPADYSEVVAVGSIDSKGERSTFSNYGDWVDIAAPGTDVFSTLPSNAYGKMSGTSMACPHVSGVAALLVSHFGGPGFTNEMLKEAILNSAREGIITTDQNIGGLLDAYGAFRYIDARDVESVDPVTDLEAEGTQNKINISLTVPKDSENGAAYGFLVLYSEDKAKLEAATAADYSGVSSLSWEPGAAVGKNVSYTIPNLDFEKKYYVKVYSYSYAGLKYSEASAVAEATTEANNAPVISTSYEGSYDIKASQTVDIPVTAVDADGHKVTVTYSNGSEADSIKPMPDGTWQITIVGHAAEEGTYTAKVTATDEYGLSSTKDFTYKILGNAAPVKAKEIENVLLTAKGREFTLNMSEYVSDPDGDELKYDITISDPMVLHIVSKGGSLIGTALAYGTTDVEIRAKDAKGAYVAFNFKVQVKDPAEPLSVYPNPVTDFVNIGTLDAAETHIRIFSQTGQTVYDETSTVSGYEPARIDMTQCPPGVYVVSVAFGGNEYKQNIVKL